MKTWSPAAGFAESQRGAQALGVPSIGVSHGTVFGCLSKHGVPMAGFDHEFTTGALFAAEALAFVLGHIHRGQACDACQPAASMNRQPRSPEGLGPSATVPPMRSAMALTMAKPDPVPSSATTCGSVEGGEYMG